MKKSKPTKFSVSLICGVSLLLGACSGSNNPSTSDAQLSGSVFASYVSNANVSVSDEAGNLLAGPVLSDSQGTFQLSVPDQHLSTHLIFTAEGGQYNDEASGQSTSNVSMSAFIEADSLSSLSELQFALTPSSTIIRQLITEHGLSANEAKTQFNEAFGFTPNPFILPVDATNASGNESTEERLAGLRAATFSQLNKDLGLAPAAQSSLLSMLARDIADGNFDGMEDGTDQLSIDMDMQSPVNLGQEIQNRFSNALVNFRASGNDQSGLNNASIGQLPFAMHAQSESYILTYVPGTMNPMQGKTSFSIRITDLSGNPATGINPSLSPMMHMAMHNHSTPSTTFTEDGDEPGLYHATVYFLMPSTMASGDSMGYWVLNIGLPNNEQVSFYPRVMMAMGDTPRANLKSQENCNSGMMASTESCTYILFKDSLTTDSEGHSFRIFIAAKKSMMAFPALETNLVVDADNLTIASIVVSMSTDQQNWVSATSEGNGLWSATGLTGLSEGTEGTVYVRLTINGAQASDDGLPADDNYDEAEFTLTPSSMSHSM